MSGTQVQHLYLFFEGEMTIWTHNNKIVDLKTRISLVFMVRTQHMGGLWKADIPD